MQRTKAASIGHCWMGRMQMKLPVRKGKEGSTEASTTE